MMCNTINLVILQGFEEVILDVSPIVRRAACVAIWRWTLDANLETWGVHAIEQSFLPD